MERRYLTYQNETIEYILHFKRMKRIYLKIKEGQIVVSAPYLTPYHFIDELVINHYHQLSKHLKQYKQHVEYSDNGYVDIFSKRYQICLKDVGSDVCKMHDDKIYVYHASLQRTIEGYLKQVLYQYIKRRIEYYLIDDFDLSMPCIEIKKYKGRWGSCFYKQNKVTFNLSLVHLNQKLIDYVIVHELAHFLEANHSAKFYAEIQKRMPDYKERIKRLKEENI